MYLFKTDHALVNPCWGHFVSRALFGADLNMVHPLGDIGDLNLVVSNQESLFVQFISQCKLCDILDDAILTT